MFLDILTKEEKEALLSKKMEAIRKKNDLLRQRHEVTIGLYYPVMLSGYIKWFFYKLKESS